MADDLALALFSVAWEFKPALAKWWEGLGQRRREMSGAMNLNLLFCTLTSERASTKRGRSHTYGHGLRHEDRGVEFHENLEMSWGRSAKPTMTGLSPREANPGLATSPGGPKR